MENSEEILKEKAYNLHIQGNFEEAKVIYEEILNNNPENITVCFLYAQLLFSMREYLKSIEFYKKVSKKINSDDIIQNIAVAYYSLGDYENALEEIKNIKAKNIETIKLEANIYLKTNKIDKAIDSFKLLSEKDSSSFNALLNISLLYKEKTEYNNAYNYALKAYDKDKNNINAIMNIAEICEKMDYLKEHLFYLQEAEKIVPTNENLLLKIASVYENFLDYTNALKYYTKIVDLNPDNYLAIVNIALLFVKLRKKDIAFQYIKKSEEIDSEGYYTYFAHCKYYKAFKDFNMYLKFAKKLMEKDNNNPYSYDELYEAYYENYDYASALDCAEKALEKGYDKSYNICRKAMCLDGLGKTEEAVTFLENNNDEKSEIYKKTYSFLNLANKNYTKGFKYYFDVVITHNTEKLEQQENIISEEINKKLKEYYKHSWMGENLENKTILVHRGEFGYGDFVMFSRYIPLLEKNAKKVIIETNSNLYDLFKLNFKNSFLIDELDNENQEYDYTASGMDLFYGFNKSGFNFSSSEKWLDVPTELLNKFDSIFENDKLLKKIGIFWQGNPSILANRTANLKDFIPLFELRNCKFYSFDMQKHDEQILDFYNQYNIIDLSKYIKNALDTAILLKNIDILVTVDSFPIHLAGALGVESKLMLPRNNEWRWFKDDKKTPWYNSVTIYKQRNKPDWSEIVAQIKEDLS